MVPPFCFEKLTQFIPLHPYRQCHPAQTHLFGLSGKSVFFFWLDTQTQAEWRTCCVVKFGLSSVYEHTQTDTHAEQSQSWLKEPQLEISGAVSCLSKWMINHVSEDFIHWQAHIQSFLWARRHCEHDLANILWLDMLWNTDIKTRIYENNRA